MGHRTSIKNPKLTKRLPLEEAETVFLNHCRIKNLSPRTIQYYQEDLEYFFAHLEGIRYADEITREVFEDFLIKQVDAGKKTTSLNTRIRGLRVFFKFCAEREYMELFPVKLMKEDDTVKEPYTDAEIARLLQKPKTNRWVEWRNWALVNYFVATGNRASTVVNLRVKDIDFEKMTIFLAKVKNRRQQFVPLSGSLKDVLLEYLQTWESMPDPYLFASFSGKQLSVQTLRCVIKDYNAERGVSKSSIHLFRHYFAKAFVLNGGGMVQLQALMGHSTMEMSRHYVNLYGQDLHLNYEMYNPLDTFSKRAGSNSHTAFN